MSYVHYKIRYNSRDEFVRLDNSFESKVDQLFSYCLSKGYNTNKVIVLETTNKVIYKPLSLM
jgi:hypothetical protein